MTDALYREEDVTMALPGHMPLVGTEIEVIAYRQGDDLMLLVNRGSRCVYREKLPAMFAAHFAADEFLIDDRHEAHRHMALMREYIEQHPVARWRRFMRRYVRWL